MKKTTQSFLLISKQSGNAAILFSLLIPVLFCIFILASDGARALQTKARLDDALEAASLAVAADNYEDSGLAEAYIKQYMTDSASPPNTNVIPSINENEKGLPIVEYSVSASTTHKTWFPGDDENSGFSDTFTVSGNSIAKRYQSDDIDIVFAADFSGSMYHIMEGSEQPKYIDLLEIIGEVTDILAEFNDNNDSNNTVGFTAFNIYTNKYIKYSLLGVPLLWCYMDYKSYYLLGTKVDYDETASTENIFQTNHGCEFTLPKGYLLPPNFYDLGLTNDFDVFKNTIKNFSPTRDTASYQGIIRSAQLVKEGKNPRRLIIVLSDGQDSKNGLIPDFDLPLGDNADHAHYTKKLVEAGMCDNIRNKLNSQTADDGGPVTSKIAVIGFDYSEDEDINADLQECASDEGGENTFKAQNREAIKRKILDLISEEIGRLS